MESGSISNSNRGMSGGATNTTGSGKGRSGHDGEGSNKPLMNVRPMDGPTTQNAPVAEPLTPFEMTQMVQRMGSIVWSLQSIVNDLYSSLQNPSVKDEQKRKIVSAIDELKPLASKVFKSGMKLSNAFLPSNKHGLN